MKINTRIFGEIDIAEDKIITFENGIIGFPDMKRFTLLHDVEKGNGEAKDGIEICFLQSIEEPGFAMPVMSPFTVKEDYVIEFNDDLLVSLGNLTEENLLLLVTLTVPSDLTKMSINLQAPFMINSEELKACQIIVEGKDYPVKFPIYDILQARKAGE